MRRFSEGLLPARFIGLFFLENIVFRHALFVAF
jgi:hypothetical protein